MVNRKKTPSKPKPDPIQVDTFGVAWVTGTQVKVIEIVLDKLARGGSVKEIKSRFPKLSFRQISAALDYFRENQETFKAEIEKRWQVISQLGTREADSPFQRRLKSLTEGE